MVYHTFLNLCEACLKYWKILSIRSNNKRKYNLVTRSSNTTKQIIAKTKYNYGYPQSEESSGNIKRLNEPFERNQPIEVLLHDIEDFQLFMIYIPHKIRKLS